MKLDPAPETATGKPYPIEDVDEKIDFPLVTQDSIEALQTFEAMVKDDYRRFKREFLRWMLTEGKNPIKGEGYADETIRVTHYKIDEVYEWLWETEGEYTTVMTPEKGTELLTALLKRSSHPDSTVKDFEKALRRLFEFFRKEKNRELPEWDTAELQIEPSRGSNDHLKDRFYPDEMNQLYEAALKKYSVKSYHTKSMTPTERDRIKTMLAQRHGVPKANIGPQEFKDANSWKFPSMVAVTSDTGLRPIEVGRANVDWMDLERRKMLIPKDEASKGSNTWVCDLSDKSVNALRKWKAERQTYQKYHNRDALWLTHEANRYGSRALNYQLTNLIEDADLNVGNRNLSWYSFRHGAATMWVNQEGIGKAQEQLRHKQADTTLKYDRSGDPNGANRANSKW